VFEESKFETTEREDALLRTYRSINGTMKHNEQLDLNDYFYFFHVVEKRGFAPAGRALGIPKSRLSRHIEQLEARLDARLIQRTSRQFAITDVGKAFFRHAKAVVEEVRAAEAHVKQSKEALTGKIRLSCSVGVAQFALEGLIADFIKAHPNVEIGQFVTNDMVNLIEAGIDLAIRGHVDNLPDSTLIQKRVANVEWRLFASPRYLADFGHPASPDDLKDHKGLCLGWNSDIAQWNLRSDTGAESQIEFIPRLSSDDMVTLKSASASGLGIVSLPAYVCQSDVDAGRLEQILPGWSSGSATLSMVQPTRKGVLPAVSAFAEHISTELPKQVSIRPSSMP